MALGWGLTRLLTVVLLFAYEGPRGALGDVGYFSESLHGLSDGTLAHTLQEYPVPAVALVALPYLLAAAVGSVQLYGVLLVAAVLACDGAFTAYLHRSAAGNPRPVVAWLAAGPALGGLALARFDLVTGVLVAMSVLVAARRPRLAATAVAVATSIKLWPVLLIPPTIAAARRRGSAAMVVIGVGAALAGCSVLAAGWGRLISPLTYQSDRGLQIESVVATPAMAAWAWTTGSWNVRFAESRAFEVSGPGVGALLHLSSVLLGLLALGVLLVWWRIARRPGSLSAETVVWVSLAATTGFIVTGKVLSPQYLLWVLPVAAAGLAVGGASAQALWRWTLVLLAATALTHLVYPVLYLGLVQRSTWTAEAVGVLAARNLLLVWLTASAWWRCWQCLPGGAPVGASDGMAGEPAAR